MNKKKIDCGPSKRQNKCALESKVKEEICEEPSTSQMNPMMDTIADYSAANDLVAMLVADPVHTDEMNSCHTTETVEQESTGAGSSNVCEITDDVNIHINSNASSDEQQPKSTYVPHSTVGFDNDPNRKQKSNETSDNYYRRKIFKKEKESSFQVDELLDEWDESDYEQQRSQIDKDSPKSNEFQDMDAISIASETSDSEFGFVGEPYIDVTNPSDQKPATTSNS